MSTTAQESQDEVLEKMLMEAQRLALRMRTSTSSLDVSNASVCEEEADDEGNILSVDSRSQADDHMEDQDSQRVSLHSYLDRINQQASQESKETLSSGGEEKSYTSVASAQQEAIDSAIKAAREMELTLRALHPESNMSPPLSPASRSRSAEKNRAVRRMSGSPNTLRMEDELNASSSHISWERVDPVDEDDDDYAPVVDYTTPKKKPIPRDESEIKWEKITSPSKNEDDYVPIADYSRAPRRSTMNLLRGSILQKKKSVLSRSSSWRMTRRRRRKLVRATVLVAAVSFLAYYVCFHETEPVATGSLDTTTEERSFVNVSQIAAVTPLDNITSDTVASSSEKGEDDISFDMSIEDFEEILLFGSTCTAAEFISEPELQNQEEGSATVESQPMDRAGEQLEAEGEQLDSEDPEVNCTRTWGQPCKRRTKRKLFSRENIEQLVASMMQ